MENKYAEFIKKWEPALTLWNGSAEDPQFAEDCRTLGFEMDSGESFTKAFPGRDVMRAETLKEILPQINDLQFLGTTVFSYWRYLTHWNEAPLPPDAKEWFRLAFGRMKELEQSAKNKSISYI